MALVFALLLTVAGVGLAESEPRETSLEIRGAEQGPPVTPFVFEGDLRDLPHPRSWQPGDPVRQIPHRFFREPGAAPLPAGLSVPDPLLEAQRLAEETSWPSYDMFTIPSRNFPGHTFTGVYPPDTVGDVGPDHYIQMVNSGEALEGTYSASVRVYDKAQPVPNELVTFALSSLAMGPCAKGMGDPIVLYDRQADRWLLSQFSAVGNCLCVAISRTGDPVSGGWYDYSFVTPDFPDYPKYSVWATDANGGSGSYVVTANEYPADGPAVYALDRSAMLDGMKASFQRIQMPPLPGFGLQGPTPAEPDGPDGPPANAPAIILRHRDTELHEGPEAPADLLEVWLFDVDWEDPDNTTLTQVSSIDVAEFDSNFCDYTTPCFPQPGTTQALVTLGQVIMHRLQYFNNGAFESLVGNFVTDVDGEDHGGVRWFELRRSGGGDWALHQEGTHAVDEDNRWMGSLAMDQSGNIALGYSVVSSSTYPALRYTGRMADEALGWMTQPETEIHANPFSQVASGWGDYAAMSLDPADDCTFWFTSMDIDGTGWWRTQIASFRFGSCGCAELPPPPFLEATSSVDNRIDLLWEDSADETVTEYLVQRSLVSGGPYETLELVPDSSPGVGGGPDYDFEDDEVMGGLTYYYVVVARTAEGCRSEPLNEVEVTASGACTPPPLFDGLVSAASALAETCTVDLAWDPAESQCGGAVAYNVYRSTIPDFTPGPDNRIAEEAGGTELQDSWALESGVTYHYVVRAVDLANLAEDENLVRQAAAPSGPGSGSYELFLEDFEAQDSLDAWTVVNGPDHVCNEWARDDEEETRPPSSQGYYVAANAVDCTERPAVTSTTLISPTIDADIGGVVSVRLGHDHAYYSDSVGAKVVASVEAWDGDTWEPVGDWSDKFQVSESYSADVTEFAAENPEFQLRYRLENSTKRLWWAVDDVSVTADIFNECTTGFEGP